MGTFLELTKALRPVYILLSVISATLRE